MAGRLLLPIFLSIAVVFGYVYLYQGFYVRFGVGEPLPSASETLGGWSCEALRGPRGLEDLIVLDQRTILTTHLDALVMWNLPNPADPSISNPQAAQEGSLWTLRLHESGAVAAFEPAEIIGRPAGLALHSHGLGRVGPFVAVINHAYTQGGELVERFAIQPRQEGQPVVLKWLGLTNLTRQANGALNDVVPISEQEFFATQWLSAADPLQGRRVDPISQLKTVAELIGPQRGSSIWYCRLDECQVVGPAAHMWNGITADHAAGVLYVLDLTSREIAEFKFQPGSAHVDLIRSFSMGRYLGDNIEFDPVRRIITTGGMASAADCFFGYLEALKHDALAATPRLPLGGPSAAGYACPAVMTEIDMSSFQTPAISYPLVHDGSQLGGVSAAVYLSPSPNSRVVVLGSFIDNGLLVCRQ